MSYEDRQSAKARDLARKNARQNKWANFLPSTPPRVARPQPQAQQPSRTYRKTGS